jgi:hypothetical protein
MKINELIKTFDIYMSNEEKKVLEMIDRPVPLSSFNERDQFIIKSLTHKSLVTKINNGGFTYVVKNV